jgi:hypothetical protein
VQQSVLNQIYGLARSVEISAGRGRAFLWFWQD